MAKNLSAELVALAKKGQHGRSCTPRDFYMGDPDLIMAYGPFKGKVDPNALYCEYYWSWAKWDMTYERYCAVARLSNRYRRFCHYVTEVKPAWTNVKTVLYADNSEEVVQRASDGRTRQVMTKAPSGDACF